MKFCQNLQFLIFVIFVAEISNKHFCELDKLLRNVCSRQIFVFMTVYEIFGFEFFHFKQWSCGILERYCKRELKFHKTWSFHFNRRRVVMHAFA